MTFDSLMSNEKFQEKLYEAKDITEVKELFANEGVDLTEEQFSDLTANSIAVPAAD